MEIFSRKKVSVGVGSEGSPEMNCRNKLFGLWLTRRLGEELLYELLDVGMVCGWEIGIDL